MKRNHLILLFSFLSFPILGSCFECPENANTKQCLGILSEAINDLQRKSESKSTNLSLYEFGSSTGGSMSVIRAFGTTYRDSLGGWHLKFNIAFKVSGMIGVNNIFYFRIHNITAKNIAGYNQAVTCSFGRNQGGSHAHIVANTNQILVFPSMPYLDQPIAISGDIELEGKPNF